MPENPQEALQQSSAVFVGKVIGENTISNSQKKFDFEIAKNYKGGNKKTVSIITSDNSASCGVTFETGKQYLVYTQSNENNIDFVSLCSRTRLLENADEDLKVLDNGTMQTPKISKLQFTKENAKTCEIASDGVNTFRNIDGEFIIQTQVGYPKNFVADWTCVKKKMPKSYNSQEEFLKHEGATCDMATDGVNSHFIDANGKITSSTCIAYLKNFVPQWSCTLGYSVDMCPAYYKPVCGVDGKTYSNKCMAGNTKIASVGECKKEAFDMNSCQTWTDGCNTFSKQADGTVIATQAYCPKEDLKPLHCLDKKSATNTQKSDISFYLRKLYISTWGKFHIPDFLKKFF